MSAAGAVAGASGWFYKCRLLPGVGGWPGAKGGKTHRPTADWQATRARMWCGPVRSVTISTHAVHVPLTSVPCGGSPVMTTGRGVIAGTFMPPHVGHRYLHDFAAGFGGHPLVVLFTADDDPIAPELRLDWLGALFPGAEIVQVHTEQAVEGEARAAAARDALAGKCDTLFGSDEDDLVLATELGLRFVTVDTERLTVPVSASAIREDAIGHWEFLPDCVRPHYVKRICVLGPPGSGKSSLVEQLAVHYDTVGAWDYRDTFTRQLGRKPGTDDLVMLATAQNAAEDAMARQANRVLFCDSSSIAGVMETRLALTNVSDDLAAITFQREYELILLMDVDGDWAMGTGQQPTDRAKRKFERYRQFLIESERRYLRLDGDYDTRFRIACDAVDNMTGQPTGRPPRPEYLRSA